MTTTPQDRQPKADAPFTFKDAAGKSHKLPAINETAAATIPGEITYDAIMQPDNDMAQMRLAFATLEACKPSAAALRALKSLDTQQMLETLGGWMGGSSASSA